MQRNWTPLTVYSVEEAVGTKGVAL